MSNRITFWAIWAMAIAPVGLASLMYFGGVGIPEERTHNGELVESGIQAIDIGLPFNPEDSVWQVILSKKTSCSKCEQFEKGAQKFRKAIGRERNRVSVLILESNKTPNAVDSIWIVDPLGNVVLRFDPEINPTLILRDLKKLLKLSKVG